MLPKRLLLLLALGVAAFAAGTTTAPVALAAATFTVNDLGDASDLNVGDGICDSDPASGDQCTLRAALEEANFSSDANTLTFSVAGTISPTSPLPDLSSGNITIAGANQTVTVDGSGVSGGAPGCLRLTSDGNVIEGMVIRGCDTGVAIPGGSNNTVGGPTGAKRNVIVDSSGQGVMIAHDTAGGNLIEGNYIGVNSSGTDAAPNDLGIRIFNGAHGNTIRGNVISGNNGPGISVGGLLYFLNGGNNPGVPISIDDDLEVLLNGDSIFHESTPDGSIGGISFVANPGDILEIRASSTIDDCGSLGEVRLLHGWTLEGQQLTTGADNGCSGPGEFFRESYSIAVPATPPIASGNIIQGNRIGTNPAGDAAIPNGGNGIEIVGSSSDSLVGGTGAGEANLIAYNDGDGVKVDGDTTGNTISGNSIHSNGGQGIENTDGGNTELAPPVIDSLGSASGHTEPKCYPCTVEVFSDSDHEGRAYHGSTATNDDATGTWSYPGAVIGPNVTATITDASGNTSEFSLPAQPSGLKIGALLPFTGLLSDFGQPLLNAAQLAADHVNNAGGVLGGQVQIAQGDTEADPVAGVAEALRLIDSEGVSVVAGAVASGVTVPVAENATVPRGVLQISPSSTSPAITTLADNDFLFRTAISDAAQGTALAELARELGFQTASTLYIDNAYGLGLSDVFAEEFGSLGGEVLAAVPHEQGQPCLPDVLLAAVGDPDVLVVITYPEDGADCVTQALQNTFIDQFLFTDGSKSEDMVDAVCQVVPPDPGCLEGMHGTAPGSLDSPAALAFDAAYSDQYGQAPPPFAREAYDALMLAALAAEAADSSDPSSVRDAIRDVSRPPGEVVGLADGGIGYALSLVGPGQDVDYEGASGCVDLDHNGDVACGATEIWRIESDNSISTVDSEPWWQDSDGDGCADSHEWGSNSALGGQRDPLNPWDFYDVPVPTAFDGGTLADRDKAVSIINDLLAVLEYAGTSDDGLPNAGPDGIPGTPDDRDYDQDNNGDGQDDGLLYDRSVGAVWSDAPDGAVTIIVDVLLVLAQCGHSCQAPP